MKNVSTLIAALAAFGLSACSSNSGSTSTSSGSAPGAPASSSGQNSRVDNAAAVARAIRANPDNAEQILRQNGLTEEQYESLMYEIAADPAMSAEFNARVGP
jgi:hypothetical protein